MRTAPLSWSHVTPNRGVQCPILSIEVKYEWNIITKPRQSTVDTSATATSSYGSVFSGGPAARRRRTTHVVTSLPVGRHTITTTTTVPYRQIACRLLPECQLPARHYRVFVCRVLFVLLLLLLLFYIHTWRAP